MALLVIIGVLLIGASAALIARAITVGKVRMLAQVRQIEVYGFNADVEPEGRMTLGDRLRAATSAIAERVGRFAEARLSMEPIDRRRLLAAGFYNVTPEALNGYRVLLGTVLPGLQLLLSATAHRPLLLTLVLSLAIGAIGFLVPKLLVMQRSQKRLDRIDRDLPELVDVLTATIESGLSFAGSLQMVSDRFHGPLGEELRLTLREQTMGLSTDRALENMLDRCDTPSVRSFVRAIRQAEALGVSIGQMMRALATETRDRRRQLAHEKVQKAPVKMLFPLVFLIFPAVFLVLMYPAIHNVLHQLST